ncbi:MAG: 30S ribosomal protein S6 [Bryobacteraceae bacterium]|nr:30S ribosomal protein S6 [Bryobacteraceae bacterium]
MNRIYEELFILRPDITDEEIAPVVEQLRGIVTTAGGTIDKEERWGVRKLAYRIDKKSEGYYILLQMSCPASTIKEIERRLRVNDAVVKYLTVRIDEKLKWLDKRRKEREKRAARKPAVAPATPSMPGDELRPLMPASPSSPVPGAPVPGAPMVPTTAPNETDLMDQEAAMTSAAPPEGTAPEAPAQEVKE